MHILIFADILGGLGINLIAFLSQLISFGIVFLILWRWGFPVILRTLEKRQAVIREGVENAERARRDLQEANARAEQILLEARRQAQETIAQASKAAEREANRIQEEAQERAHQIEQQQIARIRQEAAQAREELSRLVVNLSINAAEKVISKSVDTNDNRRLVEEFVSASQKGIVMLKGAIGRRYAEAIFDIAKKQNTVDRTLEDVQEIARLFSHRKLAYLLNEPKIPVQRKETAIRQALASRVLPTSLNLALLVVQRELVEVMPNIARELEQLVLNYKNQAVAEVTTAMPMDQQQQNEVRQALEQRTGKTILMQTKVSPDILGGVVARVGDQVIDGSVRHRLAVLRQQLLTGVAVGVNELPGLNGDIGAGESGRYNAARERTEQDLMKCSGAPCGCHL